MAKSTKKCPGGVYDELWGGKRGKKAQRGLSGGPGRAERAAPKMEKDSETKLGNTMGGLKPAKKRVK